MARQILEPKQKALEINLDDKIYGTFAEIGAGQEVARHFFQAGAAAGTIAKTMSAYDKVYSDHIYGVEPSGRYVCESRLYRMLDHEYALLEQRLSRERPESCFFAFADTVAAINYTRTIKGNGWLGLRFQLSPQGEANDLVMHVRMLDQSNGSQQQAIGILGVNLIYGCFRYAQDPETLILSLMDKLEGRVKIDMIHLTGPDFQHVDNRLLCLYLVKHGLTELAMFSPEGRCLHASEFLYKKNVLVVRGSYRPATLVNLDMLRAGEMKMRTEPGCDPRTIHTLAEITVQNLCPDGELDVKDFTDRADILCKLGKTVVISASEEHKLLVNYLSEYRVQRLAIVIGARELLELLNQKYYQNVGANLLAAFGDLFASCVRIYTYPAMQEGSEELINSRNLPLPDEIKFLYKHLTDNKQISDIHEFTPSVLHIFSKQVLEMIRNDEPNWERMVTPSVAELIKVRCLFGYPYSKLEFSY